ncbi:MAG: hypothetical protein PHU66_05755 [Bacteroidaceae bacterium]|nr:hypothetical protein [Bacteroidaceae bacterium]
MNPKFQQLNTTEMSKLSGGLGWRIKHATCCADPNDGGQMSVIFYEYVNIFNNVTDTREKYD